ncbi:sensor domain-containing diguanylate cyclase [Halobacillus kuroshimensis]|uniref:Sensor domain-containing diguanylate cyclase n=1 Tax=Halobacillus kuroshimensis TaxID=302481 RepID=A0ABS3DZV1_9BACI|nr:sensor domain-containing diguanylate cyclase [Halobacillus kuroshimensis]MBN8236783.1 sensor domain-containing diguanylate cyclase [Halobacillus kuroshimensis]
MSKEKIIGVWLVWAVIWPLGLVLIYNLETPAISGSWINLVIFALLTVIVALFPLRIGDHPVFFSQGVAFAVFLHYGLFAEIVISQIALGALLIKVRLSRHTMYRIPINQLMFLMISVFSALLYEGLGGGHGPEAVDEFRDFFPIVSYAVSQIVLNQLFLSAISKWLYKRPFKWLDQGLLWDVMTAGLVLPIGFVLFVVFLPFGISGIFFVGIPFVFISGMMMMYHNSSQVNEYLKRASRIGHELTGELSVTEVLNIFVDHMSDLLPLDHLYVFDVKESGRLKLIRFFDRSGTLEFPPVTLQKGESVSGHTLQAGKGAYYKKRTEWRTLESPYIPDASESVLSVPVVRNNETVGVITVYSNQKRAFLQFQLLILSILANYLGVAIENARHYEKTKEESERCALTGVYNYRYFDDFMKQSFLKHEKDEQEPVSLILLDIDHFKKVNDTYGHESGNEILIELAGRLKEAAGKDMTLARYGGEEFVFLLPGFDEQAALAFALHIQGVITEDPFTVVEHILKQEGPVSVQVTASIGAASYPDPCEEPLDLIRQADRAMYVGAKQRGRNRVAGYKDLMQPVQ